MGRIKAGLVSGVWVLLLLVAVFGVVLNVPVVRASGTIYIRADGSIDPPTAPITTVDNVTYTLIDNVASDTDGIVVERDNIVVDGAGYTMTGSGSGNGATLTDRSNVTVKNTTIKNFYYGTYLNHTNKIALINNNIANNGIGILLNSSLISIVSGNNVTNNDWAGVGLISSSNNSISGNSVTNNTWDGVGLTSSSNCNSISGNNIANNHDGIYLSDSSSNSIYHNNFRDNTQQRDTFNNTWGHGYPSGGNYWSDYVGADVKSGPNQDQLGSDGLGDTSYTIDVNNTDRYPLMHPWSPLHVHNINTGLGYATIQEAINAPETLDGHAIFVEAGTYYENVVVNKTVLLIGENRSTTIIDANGIDNVVDVKADGVVIEGFVIQNSGYDASGIHVGDCAQVTIRNNTIINNDLAGINVWFSSYNSISENNIRNNYYGIVLQYSVENTLRNNHMSDNKRNFFIWGDTPSYFYHDIDSSNTVDDKPMCYWLDQHNRSVPSDAGYVALIHSSNITVQNLDLNNNGQGVLLVQTENSIIGGNTITNNRWSVYLLFSSNNTVSENSLVNSGSGIYLSDSSTNTIYGNSVANNYVGIDLSYHFYPSTNNTIYNNNFVNNTEQVYISTHPSHANFWDNGYPSGGNYWSNYTGVDLNHDGIGDSYQVIDEYNTDHCPLMGMFHSFNALLGYHVDVISNSTIEDFGYFESNNTLIMHVSNTTSNQTFGFIRICIPHALMNETYHVTIDGAEPYYVSYTLYDNGTHRWIYFDYEHSILEIIVVPEFPSFLILPLFMVMTLLAVSIYRRRKHSVNTVSN